MDLRHAVLSTALLVLLIPGAAAADWTQPAPGPLDGAFPSRPDTASIANVGGSPHVAWGSLSDDKLYVKRLTAGGWTLVGGGSVTSGFATPLVDIADIGGAPYVSYQQWTASGGPNNVHVKGFNGTSWTDIGGSLNQNTSHEAGSATIANVGGKPFVAFSEESSGGDEKVYVKRFDTPNWTLLGGDRNISSGTDAYDAFIASVGGTPYLAFGEDGLIYVQMWNGSAWSEPDAGPLNIDPGANDTGLPTIADIGGVPYVAWIEDNGPGPTQTFVKRLTAGSWTQVGSGPVETDPTHDGGGTIYNVGGQPYVAINQFNGSTRTSVVRRFTGTSWTTVGSPLNINLGKSAIQPRLADVGGIPYAVWREGDGGCDFDFDPSNTCQLFAKRFLASPAGGGGGGPGGGGVGGDTDSPEASLSGAKRQKLGRYVVVSVKSDETGTASASGTLSVPGASKTFRLKKASKAVTAGTKVKLKLKVSAKARRAAKRALRRGRRVKAKLNVAVADGAGNRDTAKRTVRLKR